MNVFKWAGGLFSGAKEVAEVFTENKEHKGQRSHEENMADIGRDLASLQQFSDEFYQRQNRTKWDSFIDGLNRLPRPLMAISILAFFVLAPLAPERFLLIAKAYELMPEGYWTLLTVVIGFYFGGRMQLKSQDMRVKKETVKAAKELVEMRKTFRELDVDDDPPEAKIANDIEASGNSKPLQNKVVVQWLASRQTAGSN